VAGARGVERPGEGAGVSGVRGQGHLAAGGLGSGASSVDGLGQGHSRRVAGAWASGGLGA
jgi:hypothetical protein